MGERFRVTITGLESPDLAITVCTLEGPHKASSLASLEYMRRYPAGHILRLDIESVGSGMSESADVIDRAQW